MEHAPETATAKRLERVREERGVETIQAFVERLTDGGEYEISYPTARRYHRDREAPAQYLARVAQVFGYELRWLASGEGFRTKDERHAAEREEWELERPLRELWEEDRRRQEDSARQALADGIPRAVGESTQKILHVFVTEVYGRLGIAPFGVESKEDLRAEHVDAFLRKHFTIPEPADLAALVGPEGTKLLEATYAERMAAFTAELTRAYLRVFGGGALP